MDEKKKHERVLQDHFKKGNTFYPPFEYKLGVGRFQYVNWRRDFVPELIWIAVLIQDFGFRTARRLALDIALTAKEAHGSSSNHDFGIVSTYEVLDEPAQVRISEAIDSHPQAEEMRNSLSKLFMLYPECPLAFVAPDFDLRSAGQETLGQVGEVLEEMLYRHERLPTLAQAVHYDIEIYTGVVVHAPTVKPVDTSLLEDYPETKESEKAASHIRAATQLIQLKMKSKSWPEYFWRSGGRHGSCVIERSAGVALGDITHGFNLYHSRCFRRYCKRTSAIWKQIEVNYTIDFYDPLEDEIMLALACRIYRLTIQITSFLPNWTEDISEVYVRMVLESYIYYRWLSTVGTREHFDKFYDYGLGQQKLKSEHMRQYLEHLGLSDTDIEQHSLDLDFLSKHKMKEFVPVKIGHLFDSDLRRMAEEADCREVYAIMYAPASSAIHGMYDALDMFYCRRCVNPFHGLHKVPFYWSKCDVTSYAAFNCLGITDWILAELLRSVGRKIPKNLPGEKFITEIIDEAGYAAYCEKTEVLEMIRALENPDNP